VPAGLLRLEYDRLQANIDKNDDHRFKAKGWAITVAVLVAVIRLTLALLLGAGLLAVIR
jgi:hypothetical protein